MEEKLSLAERLELMILLFLHGMAMGTWFLPLSTVLSDARLGPVKAWAFAASASAAMLAPLFFGAMADRSVPPPKVLRWTSVATAGFVALTAWTIHQHYPLWLIWCVIQVQSIFCSPSSSLTGSIVFSRLTGSQRQFGSIRALGTLGWMVGCLLTSSLNLDLSPNAFYLSSCLWLTLALYTCILPSTVMSTTTKRLTLRERFGFDALVLLKDHNHRAVFVTLALVAIPFAAFYPFTPPLLKHLGLQSLSAWMSIGQVTEVFALIGISFILERLKMRSVMIIGICFGIARYVLYASESTIPVLIGLSLHGICYTFTYIGAQIYLAEKIDASWRTRAQALLSFMTSGIGNLTGYLLTGAWLTTCTKDNHVQWQQYWLGLTLLIFIVLVYFTMSYRNDISKAKLPTEHQS